MNDASFQLCPECGEVKYACVCAEFAEAAAELERELTSSRHNLCRQIVQHFLAGNRSTVNEIAAEFKADEDEVDWCVRYLSAKRIIKLTGFVDGN